MKKSIQENHNAIVIDAMKRLNESLTTSPEWGRYKRLRSCSAYVGENKDFYILESYGTVIACIDKANGNCYDFLRYVYGYTATSAQHISKFQHDYSRYGNKYTYKAV